MLQRPPYSKPMPERETHEIETENYQCKSHSWHINNRETYPYPIGRWQPPNADKADKNTHCSHEPIAKFGAEKHQSRQIEVFRRQQERKAESPKKSPAKSGRCTQRENEQPGKRPQQELQVLKRFGHGVAFTTAPFGGRYSFFPRQYSIPSAVPMTTRPLATAGEAITLRPSDSFCTSAPFSTSTT